MAMSHRESPDAFNEFVLEQLRQQYTNRCFSGAYIRSVNKIMQRSMLQLGDFTREGNEIASVTVKATVDVIMAESGAVVAAQIQEINQANSNTMKLVVCRGLQDMDMLRVYMTIDNAQVEKFQFQTGQVVLVIVQQALYRENAIHVIAHPYIPMTNQLIYSLPADSGTSSEIRTLLAKIQISRTRINSGPDATRKAILALITGISKPDPTNRFIESVDFSKPTLIQLDALALFTGSVGDSDIQPSDPRIVKPVSQQGSYLVNILHKVYAYIKAFEQVLTSIKSPRDLQIFELYLESAYISTQCQQ